MCDSNKEIGFVGDLNIDWQNEKCPLKKKLTTITKAFTLKGSGCIERQTHFIQQNLHEGSI